MGYERNDRRFGNDRAYGGGYGADRSREQNQAYYGREDYRGAERAGYGNRDGRGERRDYGNDPRGYDYQDRGFFERAGDEVRSWFGDEDAERRRQADDRFGDRDDDRGYGARERGYGERSYGDRDRNRDFGYGAGYYGNTQARDQRGNDQRGGQGHDPNYRSWRDRQMEAFDRDYDEYRREHQSRFDSEFRTWREGRQGQRDLLGKVQEHFEVVGQDGAHVGTVDHVKGDQIELTKNDKDSGGKHHLIPSSWIQSVEGDKVVLAKTADQAKQHWRDEARDAGGQDRSNLNRSFSGTY